MQDNITNKFKKNIKTLIEKGQLEQVKKLLEEYKKIVADDMEVYSIMGIMCMMEGNMKEAEKNFLLGIEEGNSNYDLLYNLGYLYEFKKDINKALKYYKLAGNLADTQEKKSNVEEVILKYESEAKFKEANHKAIKIDKTDNIHRFFNKAIDKQILKEFKKKNFNKIVQDIQVKINNREYGAVISICNYWFNKINKKTAIIYYFMGVAANGIKDFDNSLRYHRKALELDNTLADIRNREYKYQYSYKEEKVNCIGCGHESYEIVNITNQSISESNKGLVNPIRIWVKCKKCGLIYANPLPSAKVLDTYYSVIAKEKFGGIYGNIDDRFEFLASMSNKRLEKIERYTGEVKTILDIGTGIGIFTGIALDRGWQAEGLELTPEDCEYAKHKFDLELKKENFYRFKEDRQYDAATLFEVIEHLRYPLKDLKQIYKLIKDNGILVIATPIQDSLYGKKMKENNVFWNVVTHLSYFTREVMINYLEEAGFKVLEINASNEGMGRMEFYCRKIKL